MSVATANVFVQIAVPAGTTTVSPGDAAEQAVWTAAKEQLGALKTAASVRSKPAKNRIAAKIERPQTAAFVRHRLPANPCMVLRSGIIKNWKFIVCIAKLKQRLCQVAFRKMSFRPKLFLLSNLKAPAI
jgi:hypothetical protein